MSHIKISKLSQAVIDLAWHFGPKGIGGECCENLSMPEFMALNKIGQTVDCPVHDIGEFLFFTKSGATRIVNRLTAKGYVEKAKSGRDARMCCVVLTEEGRDVLNRIDLYYQDQLKALFSKLPEFPQEDLEQVILAMGNKIRD